MTDQEYNEIKVGDIVYFHTEPTLKLQVLEKKFGWLKMKSLFKKHHGMICYHPYHSLYKINN